MAETGGKSGTPEEGGLAGDDASTSTEAGIGEDAGLIDDDTGVLDPDSGTPPPPRRYNISSYGWDSDVEGLVRRLKRGDIHIPGFQRGYVWRPKDKSGFIESLILGLPVPNIFLALDSKTKDLNIVDGQQRLRTLQEYLEGRFYLSGDAIQEDLRGKYFSEEVAKSKSSKVLDPTDARALADAVLHAIVIKPDPSHDHPDLGHEYNEAVIQIFRRLNTTGKPLNDQEIRTSIFHGPFDSALREMNQDEAWRELFGKVHSRLKDMELVLRFAALRESGSTYKSPMPKFLTNYMESRRYMDGSALEDLKASFSATAKAVLDIYGADVLRSGATLVVSKFDAVMVGVDTFLSAHGGADPGALIERLKALEADDDYNWSIAEFVNDTDRVTKRIERAKTIFGES